MSSPEILHIKNMVCPRCVMAVEAALKALDIPFRQVELGQVHLQQTISVSQRQAFGAKLQALGFELLEPGKSAIISKIKTLIIEQVHHSKEPLTVNLSTYLANKFAYEYSYLSRLFSAVEGITIEKYLTRQKIEKVKELLFYDELSLSEIACELNYSSVAYLSSQFKKETGMTPSQFKRAHTPNLRPLDSL